MKTWDYLECIRAANNGCSDYRIAKLIGVAQPTIVNYKKGREMDDDVALRVAALLDIPGAVVMADVHAARSAAAGNNEVAEAWQHLSMLAEKAQGGDGFRDRLQALLSTVAHTRRAAAMVGAIILPAMMGSANIAHSVDGGHAQNHRIMSPLL